MTNQRYSPEFKDEAVRQIVDRGGGVVLLDLRSDMRRYSGRLFVALA